MVSAYAPLINNSMEEKNDFWQDLDGLIESVSKEERIVLGADLNGHVGKRNIGDEEIMGRYGAGTKNKQGLMVVNFAKRMDLAIVNTSFKKKDKHRVMYKSGGKSTQTDYVMCRRSLKEMCDCKAIVNEQSSTVWWYAKWLEIVHAKWQKLIQPKLSGSTRMKSGFPCFSSWRALVNFSEVKSPEILLPLGVAIHCILGRDTLRHFPYSWKAVLNFSHIKTK